MKAGFVGLGHMGAPMSRDILAARHDLVVHDLRRPAAATLEATDVAEVVLGPAGLPPGAIWIDMSTSVRPLRIDVPGR
jgi:3-hydroxyisobutyrate dehydrogenase